MPPATEFRRFINNGLRELEAVNERDRPSLVQNNAPVDVGQVQITDQEYINWLEARASGESFNFYSVAGTPHEVARRKSELCALRYQANLLDVATLDSLQAATIRRWQDQRRREQELRAQVEREKQFADYYRRILRSDRPFRVAAPLEDEP